MRRVPWLLKSSPLKAALQLAFVFVAFSACQSQESGDQNPVDATVPAEPKSGRAFRFTTWNVRNFQLNPPAEKGPAKPNSAVSAVVRCLLDVKPDVLGLIEMGSREDLAHLQTALRQGGLELTHSEWIEAADKDRHIALLSRFPITARQPRTQLSYVLDGRRFPVQRGFLDVTLGISSDFQLRLCGAHLKSPRGTVEADQALMRRNEARLLRQTLDSILVGGPGQHLLLFGDFNCAKNDPSMRDIKGLTISPGDMTEIHTSDKNGHRWTYYYPEEDSYARIDFLLRSRSLGPAIVPGSGSIAAPTFWDDASDHRAVSVLIDPLRLLSKPTKKSRKKPAIEDKPTEPKPTKPKAPAKL